MFRRDHWLNERRVIECPEPIQSLIYFFLFIILFYFFFPEAADTGSNYSGDFSVIWNSIGHAAEGRVLISHKTPRRGDALQPPLN